MKQDIKNMFVVDRTVRVVILLFFLFFVVSLNHFVFARVIELTQATQSKRVESIEREIGSSDFFKVDTQEETARKVKDLDVQEKQMIRINQSVKNLIDENQKLLKDNERMQEDMLKLRGERMIQDNRLQALVTERENLLKQSEDIEQIKKEYQVKIEQLKDELELKAATPQYQEAREIRDLLEQSQMPLAVPLERKTELNVPLSSDVEIIDDELMAQRYQALKEEISQLLSENETLKKDTIKLHYNLANLFFEQGKYKMAAAGYQRVLRLMPQDSATHYNLAFVSENYLDDKKTALKHYLQYLDLEPDAVDATLVKNKIAELRMNLKIKIDSLIDP